MAVSLVIRTLNAEESIGKCLDCVLTQTVLPDEIIIVDNESTDNTLAIVGGFKTNVPIRVLSNPVRGYHSGLNMGAEHASGDIIGFISEDCFPEKNWLENLLAVMNKYDCAAVFGSEVLIGGADANYVINFTNRNNGKDQHVRFFQNTNILYKKNILDKFLPFHGLGEWQSGEDVILSIKYSKAGLKVMKAGSGIVLHGQHATMDEFKTRVFNHGETSSLFLKRYPTYPRIYLSPFYWSLLECIYFFTLWDTRFLRVATIRLVYSLGGFLKGITK